ncbi:AGAP011368-PA-like protein [Anopheles sinensis]|uniref:AGAP011368-PA-like protein n=1 Tax=Anopheles sinensis TaxID=74873 RepID=A0A084WAH5_ANOSI|nr:AGAP011368-PA-like protein [Anopheles sinensis]
MGKVLLVVSLLVVAAAAGRFDRSIFTSRTRRHASMRCCNDGFDKSEVHAKFAEIKEGCVTELDLAEVPHEELFKNHEHLHCITECIVKKEGIADENGALFHTDLASAVEQHMSSVEWKVPLVAGFVKQCFDQVDEKHSGFAPTEEAKCNPEGFEFVVCLWRHFTLACPEEFRDDSEKCTELREKLTNNESLAELESDVDVAE